MITDRKPRFDVAVIATDLTDNGDTYTHLDDTDFNDGDEPAGDPGTWTFTLHVEPDDLSILDEQGEGVWCGRIEWGNGDRYGNHQRPNGFGGRAEIIYVNHPDRLWWEVPDDIEIGTSQHFELRRHILDLLENGYRYIYVTLEHERADGYVREWRSMGLGGLDDVYREVVGDEVANVIYEATAP